LDTEAQPFSNVKVYLSENFATEGTDAETAPFDNVARGLREEWDVDDHKFVSDEDGSYFITGNMYLWSGFDEMDDILVDVYVNGNIVARYEEPVPAASGDWVYEIPTTVQNLNSGDEVEIKCLGRDGDPSFFSDTDETYLDIQRFD